MSSTSNNGQHDRRALMSGLGVAALAGAAVTSSCATAQSQVTAGFTPKRHAMDAWMDELGGDHRVFIDSSSVQGGSNSLRYGMNILNAHVNAYGGSMDEMAMIICFRHASVLFGFNDAMWEKYGRNLDAFSQMQGDDELTANPQSRGITGMVENGVHFAVCGSATRGTAFGLARATGGDADTLYAELSSNLIPNGHLVPAGVMAATRSQEYGYSLLYSDA